MISEFFNLRVTPQFFSLLLLYSAWQKSGMTFTCRTI